LLTKRRKSRWMYRSSIK